MKLLVALFALMIAAPAALADSPAESSAPIRVLMMTGQNNHDWEATTPVLREIIEGAGRFELTVDTKPWDLTAESFAEYDVVLSNWSMWPNLDLDPWDEATKTAFLDYMRSGGGLVVMHAGSSIHYQWPEFQTLVGKTWRKGTTWHGPKHEFLVTPSGDHPITRGVEPFRIFDELWRDMDPTGEYETHLVADTSGDKRKQGPKEPMLMTTRIKEGRGVNLVLGHDTKSLSNESLQKLLLQSLEWAATGEVGAE